MGISMGQKNDQNSWPTKKKTVDQKRLPLASKNDYAPTVSTGRLRLE